MRSEASSRVSNRLRRAMMAWLAASTIAAAPAGVLAASDAPTLGYSAANMDNRVSPRTDFYRYATGNWLERTEIPPSERDFGGFSQLSVNLDQQLLEQALTAFFAVRGMDRIRKPPSTSELVDWIARLRATGVGDVALGDDMPFLGTLLKKEQDIEAFHARSTRRY